MNEVISHEKISLLTFFIVLSTALGLLISVFFVQSAEASNTKFQGWSKKINNPSRFVVLKKFDSEAVLDRETQLVWQREPKDQPNASFFQGNYSGAIRHCYSVLTGNRMGWRLPTAEELTSLLVKTPTPSGILRAALPDGHPFIGITADRYWSITAGSFNNTQGQYSVAVNEPEISTVVLERNLATAIGSTWCVRSSAAIAL